ncbi:CUE domain-containing protein 2-A [Sitodiplosis mosellana]|uniref:CUE domain-containing protein 2-A n=1 Tax=Sitodiplosis mosellana TaxID=263140 RepID=UPI0024443E25|nr:CUE domain-containing protein 2-A [Sitodiplosis mosellana]
MTNIDKLHEMVKTSLFQFVNKHITAADLSVVDEIVLNYVIAILEEATEDPNFDVDGFVEMMSAYFPDFSQIETGKVCEWIFELANETSKKKNSVETKSSESILKSLRLSDIIPEPKLRTKSISESNDAKDDLFSDINNSKENLTTCDFFVEESVALQEMFPDSSELEIKHCITIANGDIDQAIQMILDREEKGQSLTGSLTSNHPKQKIDDNELKNRIISRYSYVDSSTETKEYKPVVPKIEPKKMVRYRDNKIVSLRGERYTEVSRKGEEVELRKPKKHHIPQP